MSPAAATTERQKAVRILAKSIYRQLTSQGYDERQIVTREQLAQTLGNGDTARLLDARPAPFFKGEVKPATAARYGTLPGADSFDNAQFFAADGFRLKPRAELLALVQQTGADQGDTVSFCNTGHWAATNWFVISEIAGNKARQ